MQHSINIDSIDFGKSDGFVPVVIQDYSTLRVLMVGFMDREALQKTIEKGKVYFSGQTVKAFRSAGDKQGDLMKVVDILVDCSNNSLLVKADPPGPVGKSGADTCFSEKNSYGDIRFLSYLQDFIDERKKEMPDGSYTTSLFKKGTAKISQKVGEEAVETIIGAMKGDDNNFIYESGDLLYHLIVLLTHKGYRIEDVVSELRKRHK